MNLVIAAIKSNITAALAAVRTQRGDAYVTLEIPSSESYFRFERPLVYKAPAVIVICDAFPPTEDSPNMVNAKARIFVSVVVEDKDKDRIVIKAYRYQAALMEILKGYTALSADNRVKITVKIENSVFTPRWSAIADDPKADASLFRKEVSLELLVFHRESA